MVRLDKTTHKSAFEKNKKRIYKEALQDESKRVCGICHLPIDMGLKYPHPLSPTIDHIIPIHKGGHPSAIENLQLAHFTCNRQKSDSMPTNTPLSQARGKGVKEQSSGGGVSDEIGNDELPLLIDWSKFGLD